MIITREQIEKIKAEALSPDVQEGLVSMVPNEVVAICDLALRGLEAERAATEPLLVSVEKILDDHSAWIARPSPEVSRSVAMAAAIRAMADLDERIEFAERETAERVREETLEECAAIVDGWESGAPISRDIRALKKGPSDAA